MSSGILFNRDATLSLFFHSAKALLALLLNWLVLTHYSIDDYVYWAVTSSVLMVATASDLGIGQFVVTQLLHNDRQRWRQIVVSAIAAIFPLSLAAALFVFWGISSDTATFGAGMALLLALRLLTIPHAAVLNAVNQFKIRKAIDFAVYLLATVGIAFLAIAKYPVEAALLSINAAFLLGAILTMIFAKQYLSVSKRSIKTEWKILNIYRSATPFMLNNISGLLTYGGFIWLASLVLPKDEVGKLAVLHSFILMNLYQLYDVFLKARQGALVERKSVLHYNQLNLAVMISVPLAFAAAGPTIVPVLSDTIRISYLEAALFGLFMGLELGNLYAQSVAQVSPILLHRLRTYSLLRFFVLLAFGALTLFEVSAEQSLNILMLLLSGFSLSTLIFLQNEQKLSAIKDYRHK